MQKSRLNKTLLKLSPLVACMTMMLAQNASAHGWLDQGRNYLCKTKQNTGCGEWILYDTQSLEGPDRYPDTGPKDGTLASAGKTLPLNEQTADRWKKVDIKTGRNTFKWHHTAPHKTRDYRFFITKKGWNPNKPLTRDSFESTPFCSLEYDQKFPPYDLPMECNVPSDRSGYHVILSVWDVGDTAASFYNVMDANIVPGDGGGNGGTPTPPPTPQWKEVGAIEPSLDLKAGDKVKTRVFKASGEVSSLSTSITINSDKNGERNAWGLQLAKEINKKQSASMMAGTLGTSGSIEPAAGKNDIFTKDGSGIKRVEIEIQKKPADSINPSFTVTVKSSYPIVGGKAKVDPFVTVNNAAAINAKLYDARNKLVGFTPAMIERSGTVSIDVPAAQAGEHTLVITSRERDGEMEQQSFDIKLTGGESSDTADNAKCEAAPYKPGTAYTGGAKVQRDGKIYTARWWTQNQEAGNAAYTGADGSGKVWKDSGSCK
ncbi:lytic polysaccharide monooxygenase [Trinickia mobilis]|uniref:lytic polysaccharide monooxygenase n=1 Tax=Trinickia mobilis TaxID=2816356 RepID=UPI001F5C5BC6|nr:lytic polysaccharide monooxygenase [Trinickia mobilis]